MARESIAREGIALRLTVSQLLELRLRVRRDPETRAMVDRALRLAASSPQPNGEAEADRDARLEQLSVALRGKMSGLAGWKG